MKAMKPIFRTKQYIKYGFVKMEHEYCCCPKCRNILNAGPNYQPEFCDRCGQALDFSNTEWEEDKRLGFLKPEAVQKGETGWLRKAIRERWMKIKSMKKQ